MPLLQVAGGRTCKHGAAGAGEGGGAGKRDDMSPRDAACGHVSCMGSAAGGGRSAATVSAPGIESSLYGMEQRPRAGGFPLRRQKSGGAAIKCSCQTGHACRGARRGRTLQEVPRRRQRVGTFGQRNNDDGTKELLFSFLTRRTRNPERRDQRTDSGDQQRADIARFARAPENRFHLAKARPHRHHLAEAGTRASRFSRLAGACATGSAPRDRLSFRSAPKHATSRSAQSPAARGQRRSTAAAVCYSTAACMPDAPFGR